MEETLNDLKGAHAGLPAFILGGGPSLPLEYVACPTNAIRLSANHHGAKFTRCDYIVTNCDHAIMRAIFAPYGTVTIGPYEGADYRVTELLPNAGMQAAFAAWVMGCSPIILAGMDCYMTDTDHWHEPPGSGNYGRFIPGPRKPRRLDKQLGAWLAVADLMPGAILVSAGGPLMKVFPSQERRASV